MSLSVVEDILELTLLIPKTSVSWLEQKAEYLLPSSLNLQRQVGREYSLIFPAWCEVGSDWSTGIRFQTTF